MKIVLLIVSVFLNFNLKAEDGFLIESRLDLIEQDFEQLGSKKFYL